MDSGAHGLAGGLLGEAFNPPVRLSWEKTSQRVFILRDMIPDWLDSRLVAEFLSHGQDLFLWLPVNPLEKYSCRSGVG